MLLKRAELDQREVEPTHTKALSAKTATAKTTPVKSSLVKSAPAKAVAEMTVVDIDRVIEMAWEDRTPFEAIALQFGLNQDGVIKLMRSQLKAGTFKLWRARTRGQKTKHLKLRSTEIVRHQSREHNKLNRV